VVDYALRLRRELQGERAEGGPYVWATAYANDVFGYVASERVRQEGGYEVDRSGIYYNLPGPWAAKTEDLLIGRVHELVRQAAASSGAKRRP
jgi:neutral ceramidase